MDPIHIAKALAGALATFLAPGLVLWLIFRDRCPYWITSAFALTIAITSRFIKGHWSTRIGDGTSEAWYIELLSGVLSCALAAIFVQLSYQLFRHFLNGVGSVRK